MAFQAQSFALLMLLVLVSITEGNSTPKEVPENTITSSSSLSSLMKEDGNQIECDGTTILCGRGEFPPRYICCRNRCVDVTLDNDNCGLCGLRCPATRQCCNRLCVNTNINFFNCGGCGRVCALGSLCIFGSCPLRPTEPPPSPPLILPPLYPPPSSPLVLPPLYPPPSSPLVLPPLYPPPSSPLGLPPLYPPLPPEKSPQPLKDQPY